MLCALWRGRRCQQPAVTGHTLTHARQSERVPHHSRIGRNGGLAEVLLQGVENRDRRHACSAEKYGLRVRCVHEAAKLIGPLRRLVVDVGDVVEAAVANDLETVCLKMRLAPERDLGAIGRAERDTFCAEGLKGGSNTAKGGSKGYRIAGMQALQELGLGAAPNCVAGGRMAEDDDVGLHHCQQLSTLVDVFDLAPIALLLSLMGAGGPTGDQSRKVNRDTGRRHCDQFWFYRWVAWRDKKAKACTPSSHDHPPQPGPSAV